MNIIIVNFAYSHDLVVPHDLLEKYFGLTGWVNGLTASGNKVLVFQRFHKNYEVTLDGTAYYFVADNIGYKPRSFQIPIRFNRRVANFIKRSNLKETIIHVNGLVFPLQIFNLRVFVGDTIPIVIQHHAEPPRNGIRGLMQRIFLRYVDGFIFSTREHARDWETAGVIIKDHILGEIMEISSILEFEDRTFARKRTGLRGEPILFWTGNLNPNKDPITILKGFELILHEKLDAHLYMAYRYADLLSEVEKLIKSNEKLAETVTLFGFIPYSEIASYYNSADFFVQGSHHEGSGIALLDAIACGVIPVVTDIPSFRAITDNGRIGALWSIGEPDAFAQALLTLLQQPVEKQSAEAQSHFTENFSFENLGSKACDYYQLVIRKRYRS